MKERNWQKVLKRLANRPLTLSICSVNDEIRKEENLLPKHFSAYIIKTIPCDIVLMHIDNKINKYSFDKYVNRVNNKYSNNLH